MKIYEHTDDDTVVYAADPSAEVTTALVFLLLLNVHIISHVSASNLIVVRKRTPSTCSIGLNDIRFFC